MQSRSKSVILNGLPALLILLLPVSVRASRLYDYTGSAVGVSLTTSLPDIGLANLPIGTDISASITSFSIHDAGPPAADTLGFPSTAFSFTAPAGATALPARVVQIGTNAVGNITSWNVSQAYFISFPAVPGENPADFYAEYLIATSTAGDQTTLLVDHDAGLAPAGHALSAAGTWTIVPEPSSLLVTCGVLGCLAARRRRR